MSINYKNFEKGIALIANASDLNTLLGDLNVFGIKLMYHNGTVSDALVSETVAATLTNKTLSGNTASNLINGSGVINFNSSGTITVPNATDTLVGKATTDTLTNKTLTAPVIATIVNSGTLTLPTSTDTLVGRATTDTLTNKTIAAGSNTISGLTNTNLSGSAGITGANIAATTITGSNLVLNTVANAQLAQMATLTLKGNNTGGTANALDLTVSQVNSMLGTLSNPMTTLGDTIYENATPAPARLAGNTTTRKQTLSQTGNGTISAAPVWEDQPGYYACSVYYPGSSANYWANTNTSFGNFTTNGTIPTPTTFLNSGFGTISKATSDTPGINFSAPKTGIIKVKITATCIPGQNAILTTWNFKLHESTTSTDIDMSSGLSVANNVNDISLPTTLEGYLNVTASTAYNIQVQSAISSGTFYIGSISGGAGFSIAMNYIYIS